MGGGASKRSKEEALAELKAEEDAAGTDSHLKRWHEDKEFAPENSLVYSSSPLFNELRGMLAEPLGQRYLGNFAKEENSQENFFAWLDMEEFKTIPTRDYRRFCAKTIFEKYIKEGAVMQLGGLSQDRMEHYEKTIFGDESQDLMDNRSSESGTAGQSKPRPKLTRANTMRARLDLRADIFVGLQHMVFREMAENTFKRFKASPKYEEFLEKKKKTYNSVDVDDFDYLAYIGQGAFGMVAHVRKKSTGKEYAMKVMSKPKMVNSVSRRGKFEARRGKICIERDVYVNSTFPFIVEMHYAFQTEKETMIVMEYERGGTLGDLIKSYEQHQMPEDHVRFVIAELMLALRHLHSMNYVHRDLKPINVLLDHNGHVKLADMGLVAKIDDKQDVVAQPAQDVVDSDLDNNEDEEEEEVDEEEKYELGKAANGASSTPSRFGSRNASSTSGQPKPVFVGRRFTKVGTMGYKAPELLKAQRPPRKRASKDKDGDGAKDSKPAEEEHSNNNNNNNNNADGDAQIKETQVKAKEDNVADAKPEKDDETSQGYGASVDWWSMGVLTLEMFCGKNYYVPKTSMLLTANDSDKVELNCISTLSDPASKLPEKSNVSAEGKAFLNGLLHVDPEQRLGTNEAGYRGMRLHEWFADCDWHKILSRDVKPPFKPPHVAEIKRGKKPKWAGFREMRAEVDTVDIANLIGEGTPEVMHKRHQKYFRDWDYVAPQTFKLELGVQERRMTVAPPTGADNSDEDVSKEEAEASSVATEAN